MASDSDPADTLEQRSLNRRERLVANRASSYSEAEAWDLDLWQSRTPEERLSALVALRLEVARVEASRADRRRET